MDCLIFEGSSSFISSSRSEKQSFESTVNFGGSFSLSTGFLISSGAPVTRVLYPQAQQPCSPKSTAVCPSCTLIAAAANRACQFPCARTTASFVGRSNNSSQQSIDEMLPK